LNFIDGLKKNSSKIIVENGQIVKISKDKESNITKNQITKKWTDWIDYWSVDFDFENKQEIITVKEENEFVEKWAGDYIFENEWQSFRTKQNADLERKTAPQKINKNKTKIAIKY
jgi:hypothetical protein